MQRGSKVCRFPARFISPRGCGPAQAELTVTDSVSIGAASNPA